MIPKGDDDDDPSSEDRRSPNEDQGIGQSAVLADVTEDWTSPVDDRMRELGGSVYRRAKSDVRDDNPWFYDNYFYPYEYVPSRDSLYW
jgi:hypothetical protein